MTSIATGLLHALPWAMPAALAAGGLLAAAFPSSRWQVLGVTTRVALALSLVAVAAALWSRHTSQPVQVASALTGLLVGFLGWVIGRYSRRYLDGEPGQQRFVVAYLGTLASVGALVASSNLAVILVAWIASSIGLHQLLTYYPERRAAVVAAHKKFIASRLAELCLAIAALLLFLAWGTLDIDTINAGAAGPLPLAVTIATVLIALAALLKCAQMPLHGWLIQVMEAPTPVSALLHAGIVNLGGYLLIRMAPLVEASLAARTLLVVVGSLTAVGAGIVMMTRITIKVRLAWSTCSQMGFMLMEIGLGLYDLALLHLLAHSLYKACAFLASGGTPQQSVAFDRARSVRGASESPAFATALLAPPAAWLLVMLLSEAWHQFAGLPRVPWAGAMLLAFGLATLAWQVRMAPKLLLGVVAIAQLYLVWHWVMSATLGIAASGPPAALGAWVALCFVLLYLAQVLIASGRLPADSRWYRRAYAGFYLDERFTRLAFTLWPTPAPAPRANLTLLEPIR